ncbi:MAG: hypothetical protein LBC29_05185 [Propionibacteriaceae bacterium]|jgi:hypothetical protein|nr:hypothetical protein [Propionibacteriaceae bacterium]
MTTSPFSSSQPSARWRAGLAITAVVSGFAALTVLVFLVRANGPVAANWPLTWELDYVDNSVLFAFARDVFTGAPLDWHFSPQVYFFPEIPISLLAYALSGGELLWYYVVSAALNNALLLLVLIWCVKTLWPQQSWGGVLARATCAGLPLLILPWLAHSTSKIVSFHIGQPLLFHLGPNYYIGIYLLAFTVPVALAASSKRKRILALVLYAMTAACDPLLVALTAPAIALIALRVWRYSGWSACKRLILPGTVAVGVAAAIYLLAFRATGLAANSITDGYMFSLRRAGGAIGGVLLGLVELFLQTPPLALVIVGSWVVIGRLCWVGWHDPAMLTTPDGHARLYLALMPLSGYTAMIVLLAAHFWYSWLLLVGAIVSALLLALPDKAVKLSVIVGYGLTTLILIAQLLLQDQTSPYFTYSNPVARCFDQQLPAGSSYCTGTQGCRALSVQAHADWNLIQLAHPGLGVSFWLENVAPAYDDQPIHTLVVVPAEFAADEVKGLVESRFGAPNLMQTCSGTTAEIWTYPFDLKEIVNS